MADFTLIDGNKEDFADVAKTLTWNDWRTIHQVLNENQPTLLSSLLDLMKSIHKLGKEDAPLHRHEIIDFFVNYVRKEKPSWSTTDDPIEFQTIQNAFEEYVQRVIPPNELFRALDQRIYRAKSDFGARIRDGECITIRLLNTTEMA